MWIEQPPLLYRLLFPEAIWRVKKRKRKVAYITFDDGPIPEVTPWVLDTLDRYGIKATFFFVGDNVRKYPHLYEEVKRRGHSYGNHTMHHLQGFKTTRLRYMRDITEADGLIDSTLFRPPHGLMRWSQAKAIKNHYNIVMYDLVTRDYSIKMTPQEVFRNVTRYARNGSIIVFHDSLKAERNMKEVLPRAIEWLQNEGYELLPLPM
ncbi:MAG: polysaccharide deacetylase family protein [Bacteroides uniformis]|uniref:Polysaccharide deacetylase family protein n=1 Tax=Bacteroides uniformis TaxID=820 RepID=A0A1Q6I034_BACUN|nr:MAG: polysaccharide deacetylase family protein [Bacteroides uniformis]